MSLHDDVVKNPDELAISNLLSHAPILSLHDTDEHGKKYLVYMKRGEDNLFKIRVDKNYFDRYLTLDAMPEEIKMCLVVIHGYNWSKYPPTVPLAHHPDYPEELCDTGWMTSPDEYTLVLSEKVLLELRGGK